MIENNIANSLTALAEKLPNIYESGKSAGIPEGRNQMIDQTLTEYSSDGTALRDYIFHGFKSLTTVNMPKLETVGVGALQNAEKLTTIELSHIKTIGDYGFMSAFRNSNLALEVNMPQLTSAGIQAFRGCVGFASFAGSALVDVPQWFLMNCTNLRSAYLPSAKSIGAYAFQGTKLARLVLVSDTLVTLANINALSNTPIANGDGGIYVPSSLVETYKTATNWATYSAQIRPLEAIAEV